MTFRKIITIVLVTSLVVMLAMLYLEWRARQGRPAAPIAGSSMPATAVSTRPAPTATKPTATVPAEKPPAAAPPATAPVSVGPAATAPATTAPVAAATGPAVQWHVERYPPREVILGSLDPKHRYKMQVQLTNAAAAVETIKLMDYFATVKDKKRFKKDPATYEKAVQENPELHGHFSVLNPVTNPTNSLAALSLATYWDFGKSLQGPDFNLPRWQIGPVETAEDGTQSVTFSSELLADGKPYARVEKTYRLPPNSYSLLVELKATNLSGRDVSINVTQFGPTGVPREDIQGDRRSVLYGKVSGATINVLRKDIEQPKKLTLGLPGAEKLGRGDDKEPVLYVGMCDKFFGSMMYITPDQPQGLAAPAAHAEFWYAAALENPSSRTFLPGVSLSARDLPPGQSYQVKLDVFAGPKARDLFDSVPLYTKLHYRDTLDFGASCSFCTFSWLTLAMMWLLDFFAKWLTFGNYGLSIILLVLLVRLALHPLTKKGQVMMEKMKKLQPETERIKEKYKNDPKKMNQEMMAVYKQQGGAPILGCLPMMLQMPIWIALWTGLSASVELRQAGFLPIWITDLAAPDQLFGAAHPVFFLPMVGPVYGLNLLPLLVTLATFLQQKYTPMAPTAPGNEQQARSQKTMMYFMSVFMLAIFYNAPSGLNLYIMASTFGGVAEQYVIRKHIRERAAAQAAGGTVIESSIFRKKAKKPKPPWRM